MLLSLFGIALAVGAAAALVFALVYMGKARVPLLRPLLFGGLCMLIGNLGASLLVLLLNALVEAASGRAFIDDSLTALYLGLVASILMSASMFFMLKKPLQSRRSAYEALAFGLGLAIPMFAYRVYGVAWMSFSFIAAGADYASSAWLLAQSAAGLLLALAEVPFAVVLAHLLNRGKPVTGFFTVLAFELMLNVSLDLAITFGLPDWIGTSLGLATFAGALAYVLHIWKSFPPMQQAPRTRGVNKKIPWPEPGEDGR